MEMGLGFGVLVGLDTVLLLAHGRAGDVDFPGEEASLL